MKQVFYTSKDGTQVPMFITHKKGLKLDGTNPTLLYGYGGFNISLTPSFSIAHRRRGWRWAASTRMANLRGGGEYGEDWHKAGTKLQQAERLRRLHRRGRVPDRREVHAHATSWPSRAAATAACWSAPCMTQRPDLFGACLPAVGVMDMLRFHKFTAGRFWVDDYGSADDAEEFKALLRLFAVPQPQEGRRSIRPTLVTTADTDDRVVPGHSFKFAASCSTARRGDAPVLIRIETQAGHGAGKPTAQDDRGNGRRVGVPGEEPGDENPVTRLRG